MGRLMAARILHAGLPTVVWNRNPEPARRLGEQGAEVAESPPGAEAAEHARLCEVTMRLALSCLLVPPGTHGTARLLRETLPRLSRDKASAGSGGGGSPPPLPPGAASATPSI